MALQWAEEEKTLNNIKRAIASGWRMNSQQLYTYSRRLKKVQHNALPGELGSAFAEAVRQLADGNADISWTGLWKDTQKIQRILQISSQWEESAWIARLPALEARLLEEKQQPYFQTRLGTAFVQTLKRKLGTEPAGKETKPLSTDVQELEQIAVWLMESDLIKSDSKPALILTEKKKHTGFYAKLPQGTFAVLSGCVSVCLLLAWLYGQAERNQSFYHIQRLKATAVSQQADAGTPETAKQMEAAGQTNVTGKAAGQMKAAGQTNVTGKAAGQTSTSGQTEKQQAEEGKQAETSCRAKRPKILMQYRKMAKEYPGLFGWLKIPDTQIDQPVMQPLGEKNFYLTHDFTGAPSAEGALFADPQNNRWPQDGNTVIYGHNMKNGHLFGALDLYEDADYFQEHKKIEFDTIYETGIYEAVAIVKTRILNEGEQGFRYYRFFQYENQKDFQACLDFVKENQLFDTGSTLEYGDRILMLSTCEYSQEYGRLVVVARKVG